MYYDLTENKFKCYQNGNWTGCGDTGFWAANGNSIYNTNTGNVGIGTANPAAKLEVVGGNFRITNGFMAYVNNDEIGCPPGDTVVGYRTSPRYCFDAFGGCTTNWHDWSTTNSTVETCSWTSDSGGITCYARPYTLCNP